MRTRRFFRKIFGGNRDEPSELSTSGIHRAVLSAIESALPKTASGKHLDVGSGTGELLRLVHCRYPQLQSFGCDYTDKLAERSNQRIDIVDLNRDRLPYEDDSFALVTCIETV